MKNFPVLYVFQKEILQLHLHSQFIVVNYYQPWKYFANENSEGLLEKRYEFILYHG